MHLLLDTHVALWAIADSPRLSERARRLILDPANDLTVSAATIWEIAIKHALARRGPGTMWLSAGDALSYFGQAGFALLPISPEHALLVEGLPQHHADPFDRMLVAQAIAEPLHLVTHDRRLAAYGDLVLAV